MSHPRYMVSDTVSTSGPARTSTRPRGEHVVERPRPGAWQDALDTKVVAEGEGPAGGPMAAVFAFFPGSRTKNVRG